ALFNISQLKVQNKILSKHVSKLRTENKALKKENNAFKKKSANEYYLKQFEIRLFEKENKRLKEQPVASVKTVIVGCVFVTKLSKLIYAKYLQPQEHDYICKMSSEDQQLLKVIHICTRDKIP
ncbi:12430_t:CDS:2, partial [Dentiscutata erythropus]